MKNQNTAKWLVEHKLCEEQDKEIVAFGLNALLKHILNFLTALVIGIAFNLIAETIVYLVFFPLLRSFAGGFHFKKAFVCYAVSSGTIIILLSLLKFIPKTYLLSVSVVLLILSMPVVFLLAPIEAPNKPLDAIEKKHYRKKSLLYLFLEAALIVIFFLVDIKTFAFVISFAIFLVGVLLLSQKIFELKIK